MTEPKRKAPMTPDKALQRLAALCARSEQCTSDILVKLRRYGLTPPECDSILESLRGYGFLDDARFAGSFARDKVRFSAWGRLKIRQHLCAKHISASLIDEAIASIDPEDYKQALIRVARAKARTLDLNVYDDRNKLIRHIVSRGFEPSLAVRITDAVVKRLQS